jgi:hypothetical protein
MQTWNIIAGVVLVLIVFLGYRFLKKRDKDDNSAISFDDLIVGATVNGVRRVSAEKVLLIASWIVTTWGLVYMIGADKVTDAIYLGYGAIWITPIIAHMFASQPAPTPPAP